MCAKINNLYYALNSLFGISEGLSIPQIVEEQSGVDKSSQKMPGNSNGYLFSVKVIRAEGLGIYKALRNGEPDEAARPYVKLISPFIGDDGRTHDRTIGKTRRVGLNGMNPRWEQTFDYEFPRALEDRCIPIEVRVCTRGGPKKLGPQERTHSQSYFPLSPQLFRQIDSSQEIALDLEPTGYLYLNITIDREMDDMEFYFGRMIRTLSRTQAYMETLIIENITEHLREQLRQCVKTYHKKNRALNLIEHRISLLRRTPRRSTLNSVTPESCEDALLPIFGYLENNLHIVYQELYSQVANGVILRVWNEVLGAFKICFCLHCMASPVVMLATGPNRT